jgi:hypothetical protein
VSSSSKSPEELVFRVTSRDTVLTTALFRVGKTTSWRALVRQFRLYPKSGKVRRLDNWQLENAAAQEGAEKSGLESVFITPISCEIDGTDGLLSLRVKVERFYSEEEEEIEGER